MDYKPKAPWAEVGKVEKPEGTAGDNQSSHLRL